MSTTTETKGPTTGGIRPWMFFTGVAVIAAAIVYTGQVSGPTSADLQRDVDLSELASLAAGTKELTPENAPAIAPNGPPPGLQ